MSSPLQYDDLQNAGSIVVVPVTISYKEGGAGMFSYHQLEKPVRWNSLSTFHSTGMRFLLDNMVIWSHSDAVRLALVLPAASVDSTALVPHSFSQSVLSIQHVAPHRVWEGAIASMMEHVATQRSVCTFRLLDNVLTASNSDFRLELAPEHWNDMLSTGVLSSLDIQGGVNHVVVNVASLRYEPIAGIAKGSADPLGHVDLSRISSLCKLTLMMWLRRNGWDHSDDLSSFMSGSQLLCNMNLNRPKSYFVALALANEILTKFPVHAETVPHIRHDLTASYYNSLLHLKSVDFHKLVSLMNEQQNGVAVCDKAFAELVPGTIDEEAAAPIVHELPALISQEQQDIHTLHINAIAVLGGNADNAVDLSKLVETHYQDHVFQVRFDNCSHSSGKQRVYIACPHDTHHACFKYSQVDLHASERHAVAWLCAWAHHCVPSQKGFSKEAHKTLVPSAAVLAEWLERVQISD